MIKRYRSVFKYIFFLILGIVIGFLIHKNPVYQFKNIRANSDGYKFINPLLFIKVSDEDSSSEYLPLKKNLTQYINDQIDAKKATDISVYFRNLNSSQWISVNLNKTFFPASMMKVLTLIAVLRVAETDPSLLTRRVTVVGDNTDLVRTQAIFTPENPIRSGETHTVDELINHLIIESDNVANSVLIQLIGEDKVLKVYDDLKLHRPSQDGEGYTTQEYSYLFRVLYNGTYLSKELSERVLELLSKTKFTNGIVAGVPSGTVVSHKFGIKTLSDDVHELHDCGIVYYPENPYFVCVMTRGSDFADLSDILKSISEHIWKNVSHLNTQ